MFNAGQREKIGAAKVYVTRFSMCATGDTSAPWLFWQSDDRFWLARPDMGALELDAKGTIALHPAPGVDPCWFDVVGNYSWVPFLLPLRGIQVLHASAAVHTKTGNVVAFCGASGKGKSTLGYGLGQHRGWQQIADDSLAFHVNADRKIVLTSLPAAVRLRPPSAEHYQTEAFNFARLRWPQNETYVKRVYLLDPLPESEETLIQDVAPHMAYMALLGQAFWLTDIIEEENRRLYRDYLELTRQVPVSRLSYPHSFPALDSVLGAVEEHCGKD